MRCGNFGDGFEMMQRNRITAIIGVFVLCLIPAWAWAQEKAYQYPYGMVTDRDPMYPLINERGEILIKKEKGIGDILLQGIVFSGDESYVIINREFLRTGDQFEGYRIMDIEQFGIYLEKDGEVHYLKWEG